MERKFTKDQQDLLYLYWQLGQEVTIKGINTVGQPFETKGRISTEEGSPTFYENCVEIELGVEKDFSNDEQTKWHAFYELNPKNSTLFNNKLIIKSIEGRKGEILYNAENPEDLDMWFIPYIEYDI